MRRILTASVIVAAMIVLSEWHADAWDPVGYPYLTWGEISQSEVEGLKVSGYLEQGIDVLRIPNTPLILNFFAGFGFTESDRNQDTWNNKIVPTVGTKVKWPIALAAGHWGQLEIGVRGEQVFYDSSRAEDSQQVIGFIRWGFGGDWKQKK